MGGIGADIMFTSGRICITMDDIVARDDCSAWCCTGVKLEKVARTAWSIFLR